MATKTPRGNTWGLMMGMMLAWMFGTAAVAAGAREGQAGSTAYDRETGEWRIGWPGRVAKHDLVYLTPPGDPTQGIPLGSGDVGALCWTEGSKLILAVNKSNLWDDAAFERFENWAPGQEDLSTALRHAGRIVLDFKLPVFDPFYLSDFEARLGLADATLRVRAAGPFGSVSVVLRVTQPDGLILCRVKNDLREDTRLEVVLERFGSRTFSHWYRQVNRSPEIGLAGTRAGGDGGLMFLTHSLTTGTFALGATLLGPPAGPRVVNAHAVVTTLDRAAREEFALAAVVTDPLPAGQALAVARRRLAELGPEKINAIENKHEALWKAFWLRSLMESGDDYADNLWHLAMYYANSSQRGASPGRFTFGLWGWNRDVQPWDFYFHWNQQQLYWPLNAAGHHDLLETYLKYRFDALPYARRDAREVFGVAGAVVSDVTDRRGFNSASEFKNHTPVAEIALDFWRQYRFTGDLEFLRTRALPYLVEAASFFASLFERDKDGLYHAKRGTGYEGWIELRDAISELTYGRVLFTAAVEAARAARVSLPQAARWAEMAKNMAPLPTVRVEERWMAFDGGRRTYRIGPFKGASAASPDRLAAGDGIEEKRRLTGLRPPEDPAALEDVSLLRIIQLIENGTFPSGRKVPGVRIPVEREGYDGIFPTVEYSAVFPSGLIGLANRGEPIFEAAVNTARLYAPDLMGWDPLPIVLARLGLGTELAEILKGHPDRWQFYPSGLGHYGPPDIMKAESSLRFARHRVSDVTPGAPKKGAPDDTFPMENWPFRHMDLEALSVFSAALNEALLQSHEGVIRIAPAVDRGRDARFTLHAAGGFVVSAEIRDGAPLWIAIRSLRGEACRVANPWPEAFLYHNGKLGSRTGEKTIQLDTRTGEFLVLAPGEEAWREWRTEAVDYPANAKEKTSPGGMTSLGLPRMF
jgi:hypothetical protein